jgi:regulator of RNase E activity RraA
MVQMNCDVNIFGMLVRNDDVIHADVHGAVVVPAEAVRALPKAIDLMARREKVILDRARGTGFSGAAMREALRASGEIH